MAPILLATTALASSDNCLGARGATAERLKHCCAAYYDTGDNMTRPTNTLSKVALALLAFSWAGCNTDARLVKQAEKASDRQAEQNRQIARQNQEIAQATNQLVAADAQARKEALALQRDLQTEQATLGHQRDVLEEERRQLAGATPS